MLKNFQQLINWLPHCACALQPNLRCAVNYTAVRLASLTSKLLTLPLPTPATATSSTAPMLASLGQRSLMFCGCVGADIDALCPDNVFGLRRIYFAIDLNI